MVAISLLKTRFGRFNKPCGPGIVLSLILISLISLRSAAGDLISLGGTWRLQLDPDDCGLNQRWYARPLPAREEIHLPGTTDLAGYGYALDTNTMRYPVEFPYTRFPGVKAEARVDHLGFVVATHFFLGPVWYEREINVPASWQDRLLVLRLERALWRTEVWADGQSAGVEDSLAAPHEHRLGKLVPGRHRLTIRVDNRMIYNLSTITHAYGPETQSRWNGLVGRIELMAHAPMSIRRLEVHPAPDRCSVRVVVCLNNDTGQARDGRLQLELHPAEGHTSLIQTNLSLRAECGDTRMEGVLVCNRPMEAWDEFNPVRYRVIAKLVGAVGTGSQAEARFGFRHLERRGRAILVNGRRVFLRGTLDCAVYPRTGYPPMQIQEWERTFRTIKDYGFNQVRFHTWCPPEAAFEAADRLGLYLAPETATWVDDWTRDTYTRPPAVGRDGSISDSVRSEIRRITEAYGNHPSFSLFCIGNEFGMQGTDWAAVSSWVEEAKLRDPRRLYTGAAARRNLAPDDFWVTHDAQGKPTRGIGPARTDWDFSEAAMTTKVPVIAHETGQRPVFPDFDQLLPKFTGPLKPFNYLRLRDQLVRNGLVGQMRDFERASARFQIIQYKAEHEAMRRTAEFAGYELLMLNDFTGQSEALVGILDPFWESKGVVSVAAVREWNGPTTPLARFSRFTWSTTEDLTATLEVAHHGRKDLDRAKARWEVMTQDRRLLGHGQFGPVRVPTGANTRLGEIRVSLAQLDQATALTLRVKVGQAENSWRLWAYPPKPMKSSGNLLITQQLDAAAEQALNAGRTVLWLAHGLKGPDAAQTGFESVYWSAGWWGNAFSSLGILCDPQHPALADFPNDGYSDWQWRELTQGATTFLLEGAPIGFRPIVQLVPDFHYSRLLGHVFEARVSRGWLLVCGYDLSSDLEHRHAARQFRASLLRYLSSTKFQPRHSLSLDYLRKLIIKP